MVNKTVDGIDGRTINGPDALASAGSFRAILRFRAMHTGCRAAFIFLNENPSDKVILSYADLDQRARRIGAFLQAEGFKGKRLLLVLPPGPDYIAAFFGCLYADVIAVPLCPPGNDRGFIRLQTICRDAGAAAAITNSSCVARVESFAAREDQAECIRWLMIDQLEKVDPSMWREQEADPGSVAFLQYTSGSIGSPKGVMVSHRNLLHNSRGIALKFGCQPTSICVSWLPPYHDMGLIGCVLQPVYSGFPCVIMPPIAFIKRPYRWLKAISDYKATSSGGPNFAYELCIEKVTEEQRKGLDLSTWEVAFCGSEPVRVSTWRRFVEAFGPYGFKGDAFYPCYGMAEGTLMISGRAKSSRLRAVMVEVDDLEKHRIVRALETPGDNRRELMSCGRPLEGQRLVVVDPESRNTCAGGRVGEIWVSGPSVAQGYWCNEGLTRQTFGACLGDSGDGPFLRTGDLGFLDEAGELYVTGRIKDVVIIRGRNLYPQDIEYVVENSHPVLRLGRGTAFSFEVDGNERLVIVQEISTRRVPDLEGVLATVRQAVVEEFKVEPHAIVLTKLGGVPVTSSGKVRRRACRELWESGTLPVLAQWCAPAHPNAPGDPVCAVEPSPEQAAGPAPTRCPGVENLQAWLVERIAGRLNVPPSSIDVHMPFSRYGLGSMESVELAAALEALLGRPLSATLAWDCPTIAKLASHLGRPETGSPGNDSASDTRSSIAIIGMGCRFPGADGPDAFWSLLQNELDAITEVPPNRWPVDAYYQTAGLAPGRMNTRWGGFLSDADCFDAAFFSISPREAEHLDPQQRLLLEVGWHALEHAGQSPAALAGSRSGVYIGISTNDYAQIQFSDTERIDAHAGTGCAHSLAANRLSYHLDLHGPSVALDTACSSSLVAVHLACQGLRNGECDLALAGGVNLILTPHLNIAFSNARMMAPDGRCKTFDAAANGYVRGEGCGVVVLKRLDDALAAHDPILAVIRGTAVNQDGRTNGLTAPNGQAQRAVIRSALSNAGVTPGQVSYVETHGTGTPLGDPIEVDAIKAALGGDGANGQACMLGALKTNLGHLEAAAGVAGLIKTVLCLNHGEIPKNLHFHRLNPRIQLEGTRFRPVDCAVPWRSEEGRRVAGVSSFGFGGTNAHVVLEAAPAKSPRGAIAPVHLFAISARNRAELTALAQRYVEHLRAHPEIALGDLCFTAGAGRTHFTHRLALPVQDHEQLATRLDAFIRGEPASNLARGTAPAQVPAVVFMFTGQGCQYRNMGRQLYHNQPAFRSALDRCQAALESRLDGPLLDHLFAPSETPDRLDETWLTQPALFAFQYALVELWKSWGILPAAVLGHSVGEYVAACIAGAFSLEDGLELIATRGRLMMDQPAGAMLAVDAPAEALAQYLAVYPEDLAIAAYNGPGRVVLSGRKALVDRIETELTEQGWSCRRLRVSHAFHSPLMKPVADQFGAALEKVDIHPVRIPLFSNLTGEAIRDETLGVDYWLHHLCKPVLFEQSVRRLVEQDYRLFLEIGPKPVLCGLARCTIGDCPDLLVLPSLMGPPDESKRSEWASLLSCLAQLYARGINPDWESVWQGFDHRRVALPVYPFQRRRHWFPPRSAGSPAAAAVGAHPSRLHPLLDRCVATPAEGGAIYEKRLTGDEPLLRDHHVRGAAWFPAAAFLDMAFAAARFYTATPSIRVDEVTFARPLQVGEKDVRLVQVEVKPESVRPKRLRLRITSVGLGVARAGTGTPLHDPETMEPLPAVQEHAQALLSYGPHTAVGEKLDVAAIERRCDRQRDAAELYAFFEQAGIRYGPYLRGIEWARYNDREVLARVRLTEAAFHESGHLLHPGLLDNALQAFGVAFLRAEPGSSAGGLFVPLALSGVQVDAILTAEVYCYATRQSFKGGILKGSIRLLDGKGSVLADVDEVTLRRIAPTATPSPSSMAVHAGGGDDEVHARVSGWLHKPVWKPTPPRRVQPWHAGVTLLLMDDFGVGDALAGALTRLGEHCIAVRASTAFSAHTSQDYAVNPGEPDDFCRLVQALDAAGSRPQRVVHLWTCTPPARSLETLEELEKAQRLGLFSLLHWIHAAGDAEGRTSVWLVTANAQSAGAIDTLIAPERATLWGLGRVIPKEYSQVKCSGIDLDLVTSNAETAARTILVELQAERAEEDIWVVIRSGQRLTAALEKVAIDQPETPVRSRPGGVYLVTGGQSGVGLELARYLASQAPSKFALVNRKLPDPQRHPERIQGQRELEALGSEVMVLAGDVADLDSMRGITAQVRWRWGGINGVIHCAGTLHDGLIRNLDAGQVATVLEPKVQGSWVLNQVTREDDLDFFMLSSSLAALAAPAGQSSHVAGNAFEDAFAHYLVRRCNRKAISINWGPWGETGVVANEHHRRFLKAQGIHAMTNSEGTAGFAHSLRLGLTQIACFCLEGDRTGGTDAVEGSHPLAIAAQVASRVGSLHQSLISERLAGLGEQLNDLSRAYASRAFHELGWNPQQHAGVTADVIGEMLNVIPAHRNLFRHWHTSLYSPGKRIERAGDEAKPEIGVDYLKARFPDLGEQVDLLARCGQSLGAVLQGRQDGLELLFPHGSPSQLEAIYRDSPVARFYNAVAQEALSTALASLPQDHRVRILEVGAGTGGTTSQLLPVLPADRTEYFFTDVSEFFFLHARPRFNKYPFVTYRSLDIESDPVAQGLQAHSFDIVIAANVLHATADLRNALAHIGTLLASEGLILLIEMTERQPWADLVFGLTEGWWKFADHDLRPDHPLLGCAEWHQLLNELEFLEVTDLTQKTPGVPGLRQSVILARGPRVRTATHARSTRGVAPVVAPQSRTTGAPALPGDLGRERLLAAPTAEREYLLTEFFVDQLAQVLGMEATQIEPETSVNSLGLDSIMAIQVKNTIDAKLGLTVPVTALLEEQSIKQLVGQLARQLPDREAQEPDMDIGQRRGTGDRLSVPNRNHLEEVIL